MKDECRCRGLLCLLVCLLWGVPVTETWAQDKRDTERGETNTELGEMNADPGLSLIRDQHRFPSHVTALLDRESLARIRLGAVRLVDRAERIANRFDRGVEIYDPGVRDSGGSKSHGLFLSVEPQARRLVLERKF